MTGWAVPFRSLSAANAACAASLAWLVSATGCRAPPPRLVQAESSAAQVKKTAGFSAVTIVVVTEAEIVFKTNPKCAVMADFTPKYLDSVCFCQALIFNKNRYKTESVAR